MDEYHNKKQFITTVAILLAIVLVVSGAIVFAKKSSMKDAHTNNTTAINSTSNNSTSTGKGTYKDGTYSESGDYYTPSGQQSLTVSVTVKDNVVTNTSATGSETDQTGKAYEESFIENYKSLVVGKRLDAINLSRVSGSSLTPEGFNNALKKIEADASV